MTDPQRRGQRLRGAVAPHLTKRNAALVPLAVLLFAMIIATQQARPDIDSNQNAAFPSMKVEGKVGEKTSIRLGDVTLSKPRLAKSLEVPEDTSTTDTKTETATTPGVWVMLDFELVPRHKAESLDIKLVTPGGETYLPSNRAGSAFQTSGISGQPEFPERGRVLFEIPKKELAGAAVTVGADSPFGDALWDQKVVVPLGYSGTAAEAAIAKAPTKVAVQ